MRQRKLHVTTVHYNLLLRAVLYCGPGDIDTLRELIQGTDHLNQLSLSDNEPASLHITSGDMPNRLLSDENQCSAVTILTVPSNNPMKTDVLNYKGFLPSTTVLGDLSTASERLSVLGKSLHLGHWLKLFGVVLFCIFLV